MNGQNPGVTLTLSADEALVLFAFLTRYSDQERLEIIDQAEQRVLWDLQCSLEPQLPVLNNDHFDDDLARARAAVRDEK